MKVKDIPHYPDHSNLRIITSEPATVQTTLDYLDDFPEVNGHEVDELTKNFHDAAQNVADNPLLKSELYEILHFYNSYFEPGHYSDTSARADVLANVVAAIYAPFIHNFSLAILQNIKNGVLPACIMAFPRDTIPMVHSLKRHARNQGIPIHVIQPFVNRNTAGIANNQRSKDPIQSPHLEEYLRQSLSKFSPQQSFTEIEPGIYSTLSPKVAEILIKYGYGKLFSPKFYGLGPNLSYIHAILSDGKEWVAEVAEAEGHVEPQFVAQLMILLDSIEEFGMQNAIQSVEQLRVDSKGRVQPVITTNDKETREIASATNLAIKKTAALYSKHDPVFVKHLLGHVPHMAAKSVELGIPLTLSSVIPPDNKQVKIAHFKKLRESQLLHYPKDMTL
jgi:hypothetical protein